MYDIYRERKRRPQANLKCHAIYIIFTKLICVEECSWLYNHSDNFHSKLKKKYIHSQILVFWTDDKDKRERGRERERKRGEKGKGSM